MNKTFKSVWNRVRQSYVAVDENKSAQRNSGKTVKSVAIGSVLALSGALSLSQAAATEVSIDELKTAIENYTSGAASYDFSDTLNNAGDANKTILVIGTEPAELNPNANYLSWQPKSNTLSLISVTGVSGGLQINDGFKFKLVGTETDSELTDGQIFINNGEFGLGNEVENSPLKGSVQKISAAKASQLVVYGGNYTVGEYVSASGDAALNNSKVDVKRLGNLTINNFTSHDSTVDNAGSLTIGTYSTSEGSTANVVRNSNKSTLTVQQSLSLNGGRFENRGIVNATDGSLVITGALNNYGTDESDAVVNAKSITVSDDGAVDSGFINQAYSKVVAEEITFLSGKSFHNQTGGSLEVAKLNISPVEESKGLSYVNDGTTKLSDLQISSQGEFQNEGTLIVAGGAEAQGEINGLLTNKTGGIIQGQDNGRLTIGTGGAIDTRGGEINGIDLEVTGTGFADTEFIDANRKQAVIANNNSKIALNNFIVNATNKDDVVLDFITASTSRNLVPTFKNMNVISGTLKFGNLSNADGASNGVVNVGNAGVVSFNNGVLLSLTNSGSVTATGTFSTPVGINHGKLTVEEFISNEGDKFTNSGSFELTGTKTPIINGQFTNDLGNFSGKWNNLSIGATGEFVNQSGAIEFTETGFEAGGQLTLKSDNVFLGSLLNGGAGAVVNFEGGMVHVDNGWFDGATLNFKDGHYNLADITSAQGSFGKNTVNIGKEGEVFPTPAPDGNNHIDGGSLSSFATVTVDQLVFDSVVNVNAGGLLETGKIDFSQGDKTLTLNGGALQTSMNQLFKKPDNTQGGLNVDSGANIDIPGDYFSLPEITDFVDGVKDTGKLAFGDNGGHLVFDDSEYSGQNVSKATELIAGISGGKDVTVNFTGNFSDSTDFNLTKAENLLSSGIDGVSQPGVILSTVTLHNYFDGETLDNSKGLVIGEASASADANVLNVPNALGFMNIANAGSVTVESGKQLILVGSDTGGQLLVDAADGGTANVNGTLTLGSKFVGNTSGSINQVNISTGGNLNVDNGTFEVTNLDVAGKVNVAQTGDLTLGSVAGEGLIQNGGNLNFAEATGDVNLNAQYVGDKGSKLDASKVVNLVVSSLISAGENLYKKLTVNGEASNTGKDTGETLSVEEAGKYSNGGEANWTTLAGKGNVNNSGQLTVADDISGFEGRLENTSELILGKAEVQTPMTLNGTIVNKGNATYANLEVAPNGQLENQAGGKENGYGLIVSGNYVNAGEATWNSVEIQSGANVKNTGTLNVKDSVAWADTFNNDGSLILGFESPKDAMTLDGTYIGSETSRLDATKVETLTAASNISSKGQADYKNLLVAENGSVVNDGKETGALLTVKGSYNNSGSASWDSVTVEGKAESSGTLVVKDAITVVGGGEFVSLASGQNEFGKLISEGKVDLTGNHSIRELSLSGDHEFDFNNGVLKVTQAELKGGLITAGYTIARAEAPTSVQFDSLGTPVDAVVAFNAGTSVGFGENSLNKVAAFRQDKGHTGSVAVVSKGVQLGENGAMYIGAEESAVDATAKSVVFAGNSATIVNVGQVYQKPDAAAFILNGQKLVVDNGASLVLSDIHENGEYKIVSGADLTANVNGSDWTGGWTGENLYAWDEGSGLAYELELRHDSSNVWVSATISDVREAYPDIDIDNIANDSMRDPDSNFVKTVLKDKDLTVEGKTKIINSVSNLAFAGGALSVALNDLNTALASVEDRVSMKSDAFTHEGLMRDWDKGNNLWIDVIGGKQKYKSLSSSGISKAGYDTNSYGFVLGFDHKLGGKSVVLGGAFSYDHGSLDSTGDVLKTKNKYNSFGVHAYGAWSPSSKLNVVGTVSYMHNSSDIDQTINAAGFNKAKADVSTNMFSLGVRAESTLKTGNVNIVPHVGARYIYAKGSGFDTKVDGKKVWSTSMDATNTVQFPVGVALRGDIQTSKAWNIRPQLDVTLIPQAGNVNQKAKLRNAFGTTDRVNGEFTGHFGTNVNIGLQADKGPATIGLRYGFTGGTKGKVDHGLKLEARYRF